MTNLGFLRRAALLLWFCCIKPRRQRDAALAAEAKPPPSAPVGVRTAEPFNAYAVKEPETGHPVSNIRLHDCKHKLLLTSRCMAAPKEC